jgi:hypothetical protein
MQIIYIFVDVSSEENMLFGMFLFFLQQGAESPVWTTALVKHGSKRCLKKETL